jgi:hypothetical protein
LIKSRKRWTGHVAGTGDKRNAYNILVGRPEIKNHFKDPGVYVRIILKWSFRKKNGAMNWIDLAQDTERWWALVNAVMKLRVP